MPVKWPWRAWVKSVSTSSQQNTKKIFPLMLDSLRPRQNGRHFADDVFKRIFLNENAWISPKISLKFVPKVPINNIPALVQIMGWRRPGDKPLSEPMLVNLLTLICVARPQWVNSLAPERRNIDFKLIIENSSLCIRCEISLKRMPQIPNNEKSVLWLK